MLKALLSTLPLAVRTDDDAANRMLHLFEQKIDRARHDKKMVDVDLALYLARTPRPHAKNARERERESRVGASSSHGAFGGGGRARVPRRLVSRRRRCRFSSSSIS